MDFSLHGILMIINWLLAVVLVAGIAVIAVSFAEWLKDG
jgi:hypothetical protein